jgi:hypothetical protein
MGSKASHLAAADWAAHQSGVSADLRDVFGTAADQVFAVGDGGIILRFDGGGWTTMSGAETGLRGVWCRPDPDTGVEAFAVGSGGRSYRYDGNADGLWTEKITPTDQRLSGITRTGEDLLFTVGVFGAILRLDLTTPNGGWASADTPALDNPSYYDVWGCPDCAAAFAVGISGTILRYDGTRWDLMAGPTTENLLAVWGSDENDVFAVGNHGTILHYDGNAWAKMTSGVTETLAGVWGKTATDVWAVGFNGTILYYDGTSWSQQDSGTTAYLQGLWGTPDGVFVVGAGGTILHQGAQGTTTVEISGTVTAEIAGQVVPVSGAAVTIPGSDVPPAQTDETGAYTLSGLREGTYTLQIEAPGMDPTYEDVQVTEGGGQAADLTVPPPEWIDTAVDEEVARLEAEMAAMYTQAEVDAAVAEALVPFDVGVKGRVGLEEAVFALQVTAGVK